MRNFLDNILKKSPWDDFEEENIFTRKKKESFNLNDLPFNFNKNSIIAIAGIVALLWLSSGIYKVEEGEQGAIMRFGRFDRISMPGLNYHLPTPFEEVIIEKVNQSRRIEIGYRSSASARRNTEASLNDVSMESIMLTGDENIVELNVDVMWNISNLEHYIFNVADPQETLKAAAESSIREVIGNTLISAVLSNEKQEIAEKIENLLQRVLDQYQAGIHIEQVQLLKAEPPKEVLQAYRDVQTARADKEKEINKAQAYNNDVLPRARGKAAKILQEAEGYKAESIARAKGDTARFNMIFTQYMQGKDVTRSRLYLDTVEAVLKDSSKVIMGGNGMLPHMAIGKKGIIEQKQED